jgi:hypothetical protein
MAMVFRGIGLIGGASRNSVRYHKVAGGTQLLVALPDKYGMSVPFDIASPCACAFGCGLGIRTRRETWKSRC